MMKDKKFINNIKLIELARFFINEYQYQEIKLKNIEGIFLENKDHKFPLIRISLQENKTMVDFNRELANLKRLSSEYSTISSLNEPKIVSIYFSGIVEEKVDNIYSIVLNDNNDTLNNEIIQNEFPTMISKFDLDKYSEETLKQESALLNSGNSGNTNSNEKSIVQMFSLKELSKKTRFTRFFTTAFVLINILVLYFMYGNVNYELDFSFYLIFFSNLEQYYRALTGLFLSDSLITILIYAFFFYRYNSFVEMRLGTKKTIILYAISIFAIYMAMFSITRGSILFGPYPIIAITAGAYLSILLLPSEIKIIKLQLRNVFFMLLLFVAIGFMSIVNYSILIVAFFSAFFLVKGLNIYEEKADKKIVASIGIIALLLLAFNFIPSQPLARAYDFEKKYFNYQEYYFKDKAAIEKEKIEKYYQEIGAVNYE